MSGEIKKQFDAFYLFVRTDEKYEEVRAEMHDLTLAIQDLKNGLLKNEERTEKAISFGTHKNTERIGGIEGKVGALTKSVEHMETQLNDPETGLFKVIKSWKESVDRLYTGILTVFFGTIVVSVIVYLLKNFGLMR